MKPKQSAAGDGKALVQNYQYCDSARCGLTCLLLCCLPTAPRQQIAKRLSLAYNHLLYAKLNRKGFHHD